MIVRDPQLTVLSDNITGDWTSLVAPEIARELHLFAGQLYIPSYHQYLCFKEDMEGHDLNQGKPPMTFYKEWLGIRRRGQDFLPSHMGQIVEGKDLRKDAIERGTAHGNEQGNGQKWNGGAFMDWKGEDDGKHEGDVKDEEGFKSEEDVKDEDNLEYEGTIKDEAERKKSDIKSEDEIMKEEILDSKGEGTDWEEGKEAGFPGTNSSDEGKDSDQDSYPLEGFSPTKSATKQEDGDDDDDDDDDLFMADYAD